MRTSHWIFALAAVFLPRLLAAQEEAKMIPALGWDGATQGKFVTSVAVDAQNNVWAGTEANGLWRFDSREKKWTHFTTEQGLGDDNVYALAVDKLGRVWAGHLNHGVSVWNGEKWKNYGLLDGPLGDRVFSIATCPTDGDVWIATDCGIARYSMAKDDWDYYTRACGLPSNQIQAVAFDSKGNIFLGTQCDGVTMATATDNYKKWKTVAGPLQMPNAAAGEGLPSSLINDLTAVTIPEMQGVEAIAAATPVGVSISPGEQKWIFARGMDWQANVNGLYAPSDPPAKGSNDAGGPLLTEDWVTCIRQDEKTKNLWVGHRKKGVEVRDAKQGDVILQAGTESDSFFVHAICLPPKGPPLLAVSDITEGGLLTLDNSKTELEPGAEPPKTPPALPSPAKAPDAASFTALAKQLGVFKNQLKAGDGVFIGDDWHTQGDWAGRYGNSFAMLCGIGNDGIYQGEEGYDVQVGIGMHTKGEAAPESYTAHDTSDDRRILYVPLLGHRKDAEFNDYSCLTKYPPSWEGPDLWVDTTVPAGLHCVSLYFTNNDLHAEGNGLDASRKFRDYDLQLLTWAEDGDAVQTSEPIARARVTDFYGGVYKEFIVAGPAHYVFRVGRNHSFGAKLQGVFIDRLSSDGPEKIKPLPGFETVEYGPAVLKDKSVLANDANLSAANELWDTLDKSFDKRGISGLQFPLRAAAYRTAVGENAPAALLETWRWQIGIWTKEDRDAFDKAMSDAYKAYLAKQQPAAQ